MNELINKFSLREILQTFVPGFFIGFFLFLLFPILLKFKFIGILINDIFLICIISSFLGILLRSIDIPKRLWCFKNELPTVKLEKELNKIKIKDIANAYYKFYDNHEKIAPKVKEITEKYTNYYHYCINMIIVSFILSLAYLFLIDISFIKFYGLPIVVILILSITSVFYLFWEIER